MIELLSRGRAKARMPRSLILEPTRELAAQVGESFEKYGKYNKLSMALLIGALGAVDRWSGVKIVNLEHDGEPLAMALIERACFGQDTQGNTTLSAVVDAKKVQ